jgi:hypothetical protein
VAAEPLTVLAEQAQAVLEVLVQAVLVAAVDS